MGQARGRRSTPWHDRRLPRSHRRSRGDLAKSVIGIFKAEVIKRRRSWKTVQDVEWETMRWVDWYNNDRLLGSIGNIPPVAAEILCLEQVGAIDKVA